MTELYKLFSLKSVEFVVAIYHKDNSNQHIISDEKYNIIFESFQLYLICKFWFSLQGLQMYICLDVVDKVINGDCRDPINWFNPAQSLYLSYDRALQTFFSQKCRICCRHLSQR
jgi:hypothetical protein